jgi:hypothetical protein
MPVSWLRWTPMRFAIGTLAIALVFGVFTFARALQLSEVPGGTLPVLPNPAALVAPAQPAAINVQDVINRDVFAPDRIAPSNRYLLPSEIDRDVGPAVTPPRILVLGVALADSGQSFATAQVGNDRPTIVRVGDKLGPYTVKAIASKRVTFTSANGTTQTVVALTSGSGN